MSLFKNIYGYIKMNAKLRELLEHLCENVKLDNQNSVEDLHRRSLNYETVIRLPIVFAYPTPTEKRFQPYPHSQIFDDPENIKVLEDALTQNYEPTDNERSVILDLPKPVEIVMLT